MIPLELKALFSSKARIKLLSLFCLRQRESFYIRKIEKELNISVGQLSKELAGLLKAGILIKEKQGNTQIYSLNKEFILYNELFSIFHKTYGIPYILKSVLENIKGIEKAFIYGSYAGGNQDGKSDIDLMIIGNVDESDVSKALLKAERTVKREINYSVYDSKEIKKRLKKNDNFIKTVYNNNRINIVEG